MEDELRTVEIYTIDDWEEIEFKDLKPGDRFRLFDGEEQVIDEKGYREWLVATIPYINENGIYEIECYYE